MCVCLYTFILYLQVTRGKWSLLGNQTLFLQIYRTRHVLSHPLTATCRDGTLLGCRWWLGRGRTRSLPAVRGWRQQQQLSGRDTEPTAPSRRAQRTSLVLAEVCGWCCLMRLKMTVRDHLKQGQTRAVSHEPQEGGQGQHRCPGALPGLWHHTPSPPTALPRSPKT